MRPCSPVPPCSPYFLGGGEAKSKTSLLYETGEHGGTGEQTLTRAKLRDHNRKHDVVDVGNDPAFNDPARQGKAYEPDRPAIREDVQRAMAQHGWNW